MKIIVTGGAGFIGSAIVPALQKEGYDVFVMDNLSFGNRKFIDISDDHFFLDDIRNLEKVKSIFESVQPEIIIHLAAIHFIPYCNQHPYEAADINIRGTMNILEASKQISHFKKMFFASTAAVYPVSDNSFTETDQPGPLDIYGLTKLTGEHLCKKFHLEERIDTIVCRFFNAFGPNETNPHLIPEVENQIRSGLRTIKLGNLTPKRDFIHTHDMASAVALLMKRNNSGFEIFNLGRGLEYSAVDIVNAFERQLKEKITVEVDPARVRKVEREHLLADVSKLKSLTGWSPLLGIDEGIKNMIDSWNNNK